MAKINNSVVRKLAIPGKEKGSQNHKSLVISHQKHDAQDECAFFLSFYNAFNAIGVPILHSPGGDGLFEKPAEGA